MSVVPCKLHGEIAYRLEGATVGAHPFPRYVGETYPMVQNCHMGGRRWVRERQVCAQHSQPRGEEGKGLEKELGRVVSRHLLVSWGQMASPELTCVWSPAPNLIELGLSARMIAYRLPHGLPHHVPSLCWSCWYALPGRVGCTISGRHYYGHAKTATVKIHAWVLAWWVGNQKEIPKGCRPGANL